MASLIETKDFQLERYIRKSTVPALTPVNLMADNSGTGGTSGGGTDVGGDVDMIATYNQRMAQLNSN